MTQNWWIFEVGIVTRF